MNDSGNRWLSPITRTAIGLVALLVTATLVASTVKKYNSNDDSEALCVEKGLAGKHWTGNFSTFSVSRFDPGMQNELIVKASEIVWRSIPANETQVTTCRARLPKGHDESEFMFYPRWKCSDGGTSESRLEWIGEDTTWTLVDGYSSDYRERFLFVKTFPEHCNMPS